MKATPSTKSDWRPLLKKQRASVSEMRRQIASQSLMLDLSEKLAPYSYILSFASMGDEVDTSLFNLLLARSGRLLLPKVDGENLHIYRVEDPSTHLAAHPLGMLEPDPTLCAAFPPSQVGAVLVPGLGFDLNNHRLGYGGGHYDRLLQQLNCPKFGIGFAEQQVDLLPNEPHDVPLTKVFLF